MRGIAAGQTWTQRHFSSYQLLDAHVQLLGKLLLTRGSAKLYLEAGPDCLRSSNLRSQTVAGFEQEQG